MRIPQDVKNVSLTVVRRIAEPYAVEDPAQNRKFSGLL